jgi:tetratricopeptide (TPR) repeat protein
VIEKVVCEGSPDQSYALYLPRGYTPDSKWPVLYALDPGARGSLPLKHLWQAAETYGYIVAGSNNARNGPFAPIYAAVMAMWNDTHERLSLDPTRIYAIGFSGGARAASAFAQITASPVTAVIGCGAGLHPSLKPQEMNTGYYLGLVGNVDFNYLELKRVDRRLDKAGVPHRIVIFEGGHDWPPAEICGRALGWLEALALRDGLRKGDESLAGGILEEELGIAEAWLENGRIYDAARAYTMLAEVFPENPALGDVGDRMSRLMKDERYALQRRQEQEALEKEQAMVDGYRRVLTGIEGQSQISEETLPRILTELGISRHKEEAGGQDDPEASARSARLLFGLEMDARDKAFSHLRGKDLRKAIVFFRIALRANPGESSRRLVLHYYLACAYALAGNKDGALDALKAAVADGFQDPVELEKESSFESLRETAEFMRIVHSLKQKKEGAVGIPGGTLGRGEEA